MDDLLSLNPRMLFALLLLLVAPSVPAGEAERFVIQQDGAPTIETSRHHYSVSLIKGWVSSRDKLLQALLTEKSKMIVSIESETTQFDGDKLKIASLYENTDIS